MDFMHVDSTFQVWICALCRHAVAGSRVSRHVRESAHRSHPEPDGSPPPTCPEAAGIELREIQWPQAAVPTVTGLPVFVDGYACRQCPYIVRQRRDMQTHLRERHGWSNPERAGRRRWGRRHQGGPWREGVRCQQLVARGPFSRFFEVGSARPDAEMISHRVRADDDETWTRRMEEDEAHSRRSLQHIAEATQARVADLEKTDANRWLERTGWATYLAGHDRPSLVPLLAPAGDEEPGLQEIERRVRRIIRVAQHSILRHANHSVRLLINCKDQQQRFPSKPFQARMERDTLDRYSATFLQIVRYVVRTRPPSRPPSATTPPSDSGYGSSARPSQRRRDAPWPSSLPAPRPLGRPGRPARSLDESDDGSDSPNDDAQSDLEHESRSDPRSTVNPRPPPTHWTPSQREWTERVMQAIEGRDDAAPAPAPGTDEEDDMTLDAIDRVVVRWVWSWFQHPGGVARSTEHHNVIISALAVMGIRMDGCWESAMSYTSKLSAVVKIARMWAAQEMLEAFGDDETAGHEPDAGPDAELEGAMLDHLTTQVNRHLRVNQASPMQWIFQLRTYGLRIQFQETAEGTIHWIGDRIRYQDVEFTRGQFQRMMHGMVNSAWETLVRDVLLCGGPDDGDVPRIPWAQLVDNPANDLPGWSFVDDERNRWPVDGRTWLHRRMWTEHRGEFIQRESATPWVRARVQQWIRAVSTLKEMLLVLMHLSGGQPARGPEILSIRYCNTANGGRRHVFVEDGMMVFVTEYHKGYSISGTTKVIHRYLPREVGELLVYYLWLVLPMQHRFEADIFQHSRIQPFVWSSQVEVDGRKWTTERLKRLLAHQSELRMGTRLTVRSYRQVAIAMSRRYMPGATAFESPEGEDGVREDEEDEDSEGQWWAADDDIVDIQAGHGSHVAGSVYARGVHEASGSVLSVRQRFRQASGEWHRVWRFASALGPRPGGSKRLRSPAPDGDDAHRRVRVDRIRRMRGVAIYELLTQLLGREAQFRGVQEASISATMGGASRVLAVMGTGSGKSLTFMLPAAWREARTTVVVVPMTALRSDLRRRCLEAQIACVEWDAARPPEMARMVLVTPESVITKAFRTFLNRLDGSHRLDRIVIDECHTVLDSTERFRPALLQLRELFGIGVPMLMLTATLPPREEGELLKRLGIDRWGVQRFRAPTHRANIAYGVQAWDGSIDDAVRQIRQLQAVYSGQGRYLVYCRRKVQVEAMAEALACPFFHADVAVPRKEEILRGLQQGEIGVVVATGALGLGVDLGDVRGVVHLDGPDGMRQYSQESGRAGRDGGGSQAVVLDRRVGTSRYRADEAVEVEGEEAMRAFLLRGTCRRIALDQYLDGDEQRVECGGEEAACDVCRRRRAADEMLDGADDDATREESEVDAMVAAAEVEHEQIRESAQSERMEGARRQDEVTALLQWWKGRCPVCVMTGEGHSAWSHPIAQCGRAEARAIRAELQVKMRYAAYSCCFRCGVPQWACPNMAVREDGGWRYSGAGPCGYEDIMRAVVTTAIALDADGWQGRVDERITAGGRSPGGWFPRRRWLGSLIEWTRAPRLQAHEMCRVFVEIGRYRTE